jgi:hypothetical protein
MTTSIEVIVIGPPQIIEVLSETGAVIETLVVSPPTVIETVEAGPQGPPGPQGAVGVPQSYLHTESSPASSWTVNHNLGFRPTCTVFSVGSVEVEAEVTHISNTQSIIFFVQPTAGTARFV